MIKHYINDELIKKYLNKGNLPACVLIRYLIEFSGLKFNYPKNKLASEMSLRDLNIKKAYFNGYYFCYEV